MIGPKGLSPFDGYGIQVEGHEQRQMMTMMNYNYAYYPKLVEALGFEKDVDFVSCYLPRTPSKCLNAFNASRSGPQPGEISGWKNFKSKSDLLKWAWRIGEAYNKTFIHNWEYYPFSKGDIQYAVDNVITFADHRPHQGHYPRTRGGRSSASSSAFPDVSAPCRRAKGHLFPFGSSTSCSKRCARESSRVMHGRAAGVSGNRR